MLSIISTINYQVVATYISRILTLEYSEIELRRLTFNLNSNIQHNLVLVAAMYVYQDLMIKSTASICEVWFWFIVTRNN